ncbi:hypothetical protein TNCV_3697771 [Trichonephila clavipes]|uniref:Uncharacterized protein n=1 Tax=Trichonephila clavipes TaxID=2585209 RepID=A0A8X6VKU8_TRICX|nr:hypothetical protein TNCV_3697771 [Trichonephila clavipes]
MLPSVRYLLTKVHGTIAICMGTAGGFDEEYCGQMMVVSPIVWQLHEHCWSLKLLRTQSLPFRQQCRVYVLLSSMVIRLILDPPTFQFPQNV